MNEKNKETLNREEKFETPGRELISFPSKERSLTIEEELDEIEKNIELFNRIKVISLKLTKPSDWIIQSDDNPYLMDRGAENIGIAFGVDVSGVKLVREWQEDKKGKYCEFIATGMGYSKKLNRVIEDIGVCSQRDKFFGLVRGELKSIEDVDMANIRRKAITNLHNRLIKRLVGLMNTTLDDLKEAKLDISRIKRIKYKKGVEKISKATSEKDKETQKKLWDLLIQLKAGNEEEARELLKQESGFKSQEGDQVEGKTDVKYLTGKWLNFTYGKIKKLAEQQGERIPGEEG